jgi:hypothetical protein
MVWLLAISAPSARQREAIDLFVCRSHSAGERSPPAKSRSQAIRFSDRLVQGNQKVRVAGIADPGYAFTIRLTTHYGRWCDCGRCRGSGCRGGGEPSSQLGAHMLPSL